MSLSVKLTQAFEQTAPGQTLSLDGVAAQSWDRVVLIGPYTPAAVAEKALGTAPDPVLKAIAIDSRDDVNALVLLNEGRIVAAVALPRRVADFEKTELLRPVPRPQARLQRASSGVHFRWQS